MLKYFLSYLLIINLITFLLYAIDKRRSIRKAWRIPESVLMGFVTFGGSVGAMLAMLLFRHKTKHAKFTVGVPLILVAQIIVVLSFYKYLSWFCKRITSSYLPTSIHWSFWCRYP